MNPIADLRVQLCLPGAHPIIQCKSSHQQPGTLDRVRHAKRKRMERFWPPHQPALSLPLPAPEVWEILPLHR